MKRFVVVGHRFGVRPHSVRTNGSFRGGVRM